MNEKKILRVGIYLRLSDEDRYKDDKDDNSESIKNQRNMLLEEIAKRSNYVLVDEYCDEDLSGAGTYRPEFERLIKDCENRKIDIVMCKSQSRFSRDMEVIERFIHNKFIEWNIRFIGLVDNADTENSGNKKSRQINGLVNEWYLEDVSNNIRSAFNIKMKRGEYISPFASYGYDISSENNNKLVVDPVASLVVKDIFSMYLSGLGFMGIAKRLNDCGVSCPSLYKYKKGIKLNVVSNRCREDIKWSSSAIKRILTNEVYLGHLIQGKRTTISYKNHKIKNKCKDEWIKINNTHEAIIRNEIFDRVQLMIKERARVKKNINYVHVFSGKVFCLECGRCMRKKNSSKNEYLVCSGNEYNECCNKKSIRYDVLEKIILDKLNNKITILFDDNIFEKIGFSDSNDEVKKKIKLLENMKVEIKKKLLKIKNCLKKIYEDRVDGIISLEQFVSLMNNYNNDEKNFNKELRLINKEIDYYKNIMLDGLKIFFNGKCFNQLDRIIIEEFIDKIYIGCLVDSKREIEIRWNF